MVFIISYKDAEKILLNLGYTLTISPSHHIFRKKGFISISLKKSSVVGLSSKRFKRGLINNGYSEKK